MKIKTINVKVKSSKVNMLEGFNSIEDLYNYAKAQGIEKLPFGVGISGTAYCPDCGDDVSCDLMSGLNLNESCLEVGSYWKNNKKIIDNFVWLGLVEE